MQLNLEQKAVTVNTKTKESRNGNNGGKVLGIPAGQFQKRGDLGREKIDFGKNKCIQRRRGKKHKKKQMKKQGTEFSAIYQNPSLTW